MKFTQIPTDTYAELQLNAGILLSSFDPSTATVTASNIIGATSGGSNFNSNPQFSDFGSDIDNVPANTKQLKRIDYYNPTLSGTFATLDTTLGKKLLAAADTDSANTAHLIPREQLDTADFGDIWWVGDYSDKNGTTNGGFIAIKVKNALNTGGFQLKSQKNGKGMFAFTFTGHYDLSNISACPFELYIKAGTAEPTPEPDPDPEET